MRFILAIVVAGFAVGCATLPEVHPWYRATGETRVPALVSARGPLSPERAEAVLARLGAQGKSDVLARHIAIEGEVSGAPLTLGNAATLLTDGPASYASMFKAVAAARDHVNIEFYIIEDDEVGRQFSDVLLRKAAEGVAVNLMYDSVGCIDTPPSFFERLRAGGVKVLEYNPVNPLKARSGWRVNNRNHRKIVIVDGRMAYTGGINISSVYSHGSAPGGPSSRYHGSSGSRAGSGMSGGSSQIGWRDTNVRLEGPVVPQLQRLFLDTWAKQQGEPLPQRDWFPQLQRAGEYPARILASGPDDAVPAIYVSLLSAIALAEKTVHITMAYFVPDAQTVAALTRAARRGVDVTLVLPSYTDFWAVFHAGRSHYTELLDAGVKVYERQKTLLHAKTVVVDGVWSTVGSSNMDWRSFVHNQELNAVVLGMGFGKQMEAMFEQDLGESVRIDADAWRSRPISVRMKEWAARAWEYWL
jgi:cardiolipin synthase A/B